MTWTPAQTDEHRRRFPWSYGVNYIPADAINQLEMWQADTFNPARIAQELDWGRPLGVRLLRVYLHDLLYEQDAAGFLDRMERFLDIAAARGCYPLFTVFDDCWNPGAKLGPQPSPKPFTHNSGWLQSPGHAVADDRTNWPRLERYVTAVLKRFAGDSRIYGWDLYNEPGGGERGVPDKSFPLLRAVFEWARSVGPSQPLTAGLWKYEPAFEELNAFQAEASDLLSFHDYAPEPEFSTIVTSMLALARGRRVLCSEFVARPGNSLAGMLPAFRAAGIDAVQWGFVAGKTQTIYPWGWSPEKGEPAFWHHDLLLPDGSAKYPEEERFLVSIFGA